MALVADAPPRLRSGRPVANFIDDLTQFDSIVVTPGLPLNRHPIAGAPGSGRRDHWRHRTVRPGAAELPPHKVVGITGTNGKSTTTALVHHILQTAGVPSLMGGNIGLPILAQDPLPEGGVYVLELSSYQIDLTQASIATSRCCSTSRPIISTATTASRIMRLRRRGYSRCSHRASCRLSPDDEAVPDVRRMRLQHLGNFIDSCR